MGAETANGGIPTRLLYATKLRAGRAASHPPGTVPVMAHRILHLSDTHLFGDDARHYGVTDTAANLRAVLARASTLADLDAVIVTGDCSEDGSDASYELLRDTVTPWAAERGAHAVFVMGNHDQRAGFRAVLGDGTGGTGVADAPVEGAVELDGLRIVTVDTSVPGAGYGELEGAQLDRLRGILAVPAEHGTLLALHHPPVRAQTDLLQALALQRPEELAEVIRGTDVRVILAGHYHHPLVATFAGIPVVVSAAVTNLADAVGDPALEVSSAGAGGTLVELDGDDLRVVPFRALVEGDGEQVFAFDREQVAAIIAAAGPKG